MTFLATGKVNYPARIERALALSDRYTFAGEILNFYGHILQFQREFQEQLPKLWGKRAVAPESGGLRAELNLPVVLGPFEKYLSLAESVGPGPLARESSQMKNKGENEWAAALAAFWKSGLLESATSEPLSEFLVRAFLQPYAEFLVGAMLPPVLPMTVCRCPRCNALPLLGVLRPEGEGGKRFLQCSFCSQEWEFRRILCAYCGEEKEQQLPVYVAELFPHIRVECCETCKHYLRTIDLTKDGHAVPIVDDLAAIPLTLWAEENGYKRIQGNLLRT
jgi:formate dehydrogenase accessory protein FdhE